MPVELFSFEYHRGVALLDLQQAKTGKRDWELESALAYVRKSLGNLPNAIDAEKNLRDVLRRFESTADGLTVAQGV